MKTATKIISILAIMIIVLNIIQLNLNDIFSDKNTVSLITIIAGFCCLLILRIIVITKKIKNYKKGGD